jgi:cytochrome c biogenesis protein CcmG/thiol:disulfide interchange protein DsbE
MSVRRLPALLLLTAAPFLLAGAAADEDATAPVPAWNAKCADGSRFDFHEALAEGPVVVSFWATWCKPCLRELPHLARLQEQYDGRLTVAAVNIDDTRSVNKVRPFLKSKSIDLRVPMDTSGDIRRLLQVGNTFPYLILYAADGREVYRHVGYKDGDEMELAAQVAALLGEDDS